MQRKEMERIVRRGKNWNKDGSGRPAQRASTWSKCSTGRDPKKNRRQSKRDVEVQWVG
jgi:hypothetical protein